MVCSKYSELTIPQRTVAIGELIHAFQSDNEAFIAMLDIVVDAKIRGVFKGVIVNPDRVQMNDSQQEM